MASRNPRPALHVEGDDDFHAIIHLMKSFGVDYENKPWPDRYPELKNAKGVEKLLNGMEVAIAEATDNTVGFVLDADDLLADRWTAVADRLRRNGVAAPATPEPSGFIGTSTNYKARVGVWLMPDNVRDGKLEDFLRDLIETADPMIEHAIQATNQAAEIRLSQQPSLPAFDGSKATIHSWLAWQEVPGRPFGIALQSKYFQPTRPAGQNFAAWFKALFLLEDSAS